MTVHLDAAAADACTAAATLAEPDVLERGEPQVRLGALHLFDGGVSLSPGALLVVAKIPEVVAELCELGLDHLESIGRHAVQRSADPDGVIAAELDRCHEVSVSLGGVRLST